MTNNRQEHEPGLSNSRRSVQPSKDWKRVHDAEEELRSISPAFKKIEQLKAVQPSPQEWKDFTQRLSSQLGSSKVPLMRTLRDRITTTDSLLIQWFWVIIALLALAILAGIIAFSLNGPSIISYQKSLTYINNGAPMPKIERTQAFQDFSSTMRT